MRKILFTLTFALMAFLAHAETEIDGIFYILNSSARTAKVTYGSKEYLGTVIIPSTVSYRGYSYLVTSIGNFAFDGFSGLTSVLCCISLLKLMTIEFYRKYTKDYLQITDVGETSQIKQQAFRVTMTFMVLRTTIFKMKDIWRLHTKKDMYKRLASVHSKVGRGSLIPHLYSVRSEFATLKQTYCEFSMANSIVISCTQFDRI